MWCFQKIHQQHWDATSPTGMLLQWRAASPTTASSMAHVCVQAATRKRMTVLSPHSNLKLAFNLQYQTPETKVSSPSHFSQKSWKKIVKANYPDILYPTSFAWAYRAAQDYVADYPANSIALSLRKGTKLIKNDTRQLPVTLTSLPFLTEALHFLSLLQNM